MNDFLPIGSVVLLKESTKKVMICGRIQNLDGKIYDYSGCLYPEGYLGAQQMYAFNNEDIDKLYYVGMQDEEEFKFRQYMIDQIENAAAGEE